MKVVLTQHAKRKCTELGLSYRDAEYYAWVARHATPEELSQIYNAKRRPYDGGEKGDLHLIHLKYCFVAKDHKNVRTVITVYNPEYLFRTVNTLPKREVKLEVIEEKSTKEEKARTSAVFAATEHFAKRLLHLYKTGKKIFYYGRACEVIDGDIYWEPGIYVKMACNSKFPGKFSEKFITKCFLLHFEVKDDDTGNCEVCPATCQPE
jgi:hypothetical protein